MFPELDYAKTINRFKANKGVKTKREVKYAYEKHWKAQKNRAMQVHSRRDNYFDEETFLPEPHLSRWETHHENVKAEYEVYCAYQNHLNQLFDLFIPDSQLKYMTRAYPVGLGAGW